MNGMLPPQWAQEPGCLMLPHIVVVRAAGAAVRPFLARQLTCDVGALAPGRPLFGAWLTAKGRVLCLLRLIAPDDAGVLLLLPAALASDVIARMRMFVLRDDVTLEPAPQMLVAGLAGSAVDAVAAAPLQDLGGHLLPLGAQPPSALLVGPPAAVQAVTAQVPVLDADRWHGLQILAGLPEVGPVTRESFIPQMLNLDRLGAVSFAKGCYPGQEIVARTQHLGRIKRRMYIARSAGDIVAMPGDPISVNGASDAPGRVVLAARVGSDQMLLVVLPLDAVACGAAFRLDGPQGPKLEISAPPYPLDDAIR
jgi:folate-binding protein YgfZ